MDLAVFCQIFFGLISAIGLGCNLITPIREQILNYGSRGTSAKGVEVRTERSNSAKFYEFVASLQVPHAWFTHYYVVSVASSIFWAVQIFTQGHAFKFLSIYSLPIASSMTANQVFLAWLLLAIQGMRRLYESISLTKPSHSKMWFGLWLVGISFYIVMGISVWIEGISVLNQSKSFKSLLDFSKPSLKTLIAVPIFVLASSIQHDCHQHLASLEKYTLPQHSLFRFIVCPHYTSECFVYFAIAIVAAPPGQLFNRTVVAGLMFVVCNLSVTANSTRNWYVEKFGAEKLAGRWRIFPYVY